MLLILTHGKVSSAGKDFCATLSESDCVLLHSGYFLCLCAITVQLPAYICSLLWMVSGIRNGERAALDKICPMALMSASAQGANLLLVSYKTCCMFHVL